jgi:MazG family protein
MSTVGFTPDDVILTKDPIYRLVKIMELLRGPEGCPWDRKQTLDSLRTYLVEEAYEVLDALDSGNPSELRDELGDLLLQIVFQSQLANESGWFDFRDVAEAICRKLIRRHPHIFATETADTPKAVLEQWERIKKQERSEAADSQRGESTQPVRAPTVRGPAAAAGLLSGIPKHLPALLKAYRIGQKTSRVGFDWPDVQGPLNKVAEEIGELAACTDPATLFHELGDVLLAITNVARHLNVDPEQALQSANARFMRRFAYVEQQAEVQGRDMKTMTLDELDIWWNEAKSLE